MTAIQILKNRLAEFETIRRFAEREILSLQHAIAELEETKVRNKDLRELVEELMCALVKLPEIDPSSQLENVMGVSLQDFSAKVNLGQSVEVVTKFGTYKYNKETGEVEKVREPKRREDRE